MPASEDLSKFTDVIGIQAAYALVGAHGGLVYDVPATPRGKCFAALAELIGDAAANAFIEVFGGDRVYVPKCDSALRAMRDAEIIAGYPVKSVPQLARQYRLCERQIYNILGRPTPAPDPACPLTRRGDHHEDR